MNRQHISTPYKDNYCLKFRGSPIVCTIETMMHDDTKGTSNCDDCR